MILINPDIPLTKAIAWDDEKQEVEAWETRRMNNVIKSSYFSTMNWQKRDWFVLRLERIITKYMWQYGYSISTQLIIRLETMNSQNIGGGHIFEKTIKAAENALWKVELQEELINRNKNCEEGEKTKIETFKIENDLWKNYF